MRNRAAILLCTLLLGGLVGAQPQTIVPSGQIARMPGPPLSPTFRLYFLGHEVGIESSSGPLTIYTNPPPPVTSTQYLLRFVERGTEVQAFASLGLLDDGSPYHFKVEGRNYRLFASDSEVEIGNGRARVRDVKATRDISLAGGRFFPVDNYAPIGIQEELIRYCCSGSPPGRAGCYLPRCVRAIRPASAGSLPRQWQIALPISRS